MEFKADFFCVQKVSKLATMHEKFNSEEVKGMELVNGWLLGLT